MLKTTVDHKTTKNWGLSMFQLQRLRVLGSGVDGSALNGIAMKIVGPVLLTQYMNVREAA